MMKKLSLAFLSLASMALLGMVPFHVASAAASDPVDVFDGACSGTNKADFCPDSSGDGVFGIIKIVIQVLLIVGGIIAVIMIIIGGIRYMTSNGDSADVKAAKDTILYSIIGLVVAMGAYAIVTWVVDQF